MCSRSLLLGHARTSLSHGVPRRLCGSLLALFFVWSCPQPLVCAEAQTGRGTVERLTRADLQSSDTSDHEPMALVRSALAARSDLLRRSVLELMPPSATAKVALGPVTSLSNATANRSAGIKTMLQSVLEKAGFAVSTSALDPAPVIVGLEYRFVVDTADGSQPATGFQEFVLTVKVGNRQGAVRDFEIVVPSQVVEQSRALYFWQYMTGATTLQVAPTLVAPPATADGPGVVPTPQPQPEPQPQPQPEPQPQPQPEPQPQPQPEPQPQPQPEPQPQPQPEPQPQPQPEPQPVDPGQQPGGATPPISPQPDPPQPVIVPQPLPPHQVLIHVQSGDRWVERPIRPLNNLWVVDLQQNETFAIELVNNSEQDIAVRLTLDGVSVFQFSSYRGKYSYYVVPKKSRLWVPGWHNDNKVSQAFVIGEYAGSANSEVLKQPSAVGTITAEFAKVWHDPKERPADEPETRAASTPRKAIHRGPQVKGEFAETHVYCGQFRGMISIVYAMPEDQVAPAPAEPSAVTPAPAEPSDATPPEPAANTSPAQPAEKQPAEPQKTEAESEGAGPSGSLPLQGSPADGPSTNAAAEHGAPPPPSTGIPSISDSHNRWAVLVVASNYRDLVPLPSRHESMMELKKCLAASGFPDDHICVLSDRGGEGAILPTRENIEKVLRWIRGQHGEKLHLPGHSDSLTSDDELVMAVALYGINDQQRQMICPLDTEVRETPDGRLATKNLLPLDDIQAAMAACQASRKLLVLDIFRECPRAPSRSATGGMSEALGQWDETAVSPPAGFAALIGYDDRDKGVQFVGSFLNTTILGLRGHADRTEGNRDNLVTLHELAAYVEKYGTINSHATNGARLVGEDYPLARMDLAAVVPDARGDLASTLFRTGAALNQQQASNEAKKAFDRAWKIVEREIAEKRPVALRLPGPARLKSGTEILRSCQVNDEVTVSRLQDGFVAITAINGQATLGWIHKGSFEPKTTGRPRSGQATAAGPMSNTGDDGYDFGYDDGYDYDTYDDDE